MVPVLVRGGNGVAVALAVGVGSRVCVTDGVGAAAAVMTSRNIRTQMRCTRGLLIIANRC